MIFIQNQKVILPKSHGEKEGVIVLIPKTVREQKGLTQVKGRVKVSYMTVGGGATEAWFAIESLQAWRKPADITAELETKHQKEMDAVHAQQDKEKLDWIQGKEEEEVKKDKQGQDIVDTTPEDTIELTKDINIQEELKKLGVKVDKANQVIPKKDDDNSDKYIG